MGMSTNSMGALGELTAALEFERAGCPVYTRIVDAGSTAVDFVVDVDNRMYRVQVKYVTTETEKFIVDYGKSYSTNSFDLLVVVWRRNVLPHSRTKVFLMRWPLENQRSLTFDEGRQDDYDFYKVLTELRL